MSMFFYYYGTNWKDKVRFGYLALSSGVTIIFFRRILTQATKKVVAFLRPVHMEKKMDRRSLQTPMSHVDRQTMLQAFFHYHTPGSFKEQPVG